MNMLLGLLFSLLSISSFCAWKIIGKFILKSTNPNTNPNIIGKSTNIWFFKDPKYKYKDKYTNTQNGKHKYDIFGYLGSKIPQSFGTQIYLYPIMQVLGHNHATISISTLVVEQKRRGKRKRHCVSAEYHLSNSDGFQPSKQTSPLVLLVIFCL